MISFNQELWTKKKIFLGVFSFLIVFLLIFMFIWILRGSPENASVGTGQVVEGVEDTESQITESCSDSDGRNYLIQGSVRYCDSNGVCSDKVDSCAGSRVVEWYCSDNKGVSEQKECDFDCDEGSCVNLVTKKSSSGGGGSGGGGGGGGSGGGSSGGSSTPAVVVEEVAQTYEIGELTTEHNLELVKGEKIDFSISGTDYLLELEENSATGATISVGGVRTFSLIVGEESAVDLNGSEGAEIYIRVVTINLITNKVKLIWRLV